MTTISWKRRAVAVCAVLLVAVAGAAAYHAQLETSRLGRLSGTVEVYDCMGRLLPVSGATVRASGPTVVAATTRSDGTFALSLPPGSYVVTVTAPCCPPFFNSVTIAPGLAQTIGYYLAATNC